MRRQSKSLAVALVALVCGFVSAGSASPAWEAGAYWSYETTSIGWGGGRTIAGEMTFVVLAGGTLDDWSVVTSNWRMAAITEWYDSAELLFLTSHQGPATTGAHWSPVATLPWLRWPQVVDYIPPASIPGIQGALRQSLRPVWLPGLPVGQTLRLETLGDGGVAQETIELTELATETAETPAGSFEGATRIGYSWSSFGESRVDGLAWWSPDVGWWVRAEGEDGQLGVHFELILTDFGVLTADELRARLSDALTSSSAIDPDWADGMRNVLLATGITIEAD